MSIDPYTAPNSRRAANETVELRVKRLVDRYRAAVGLPAVTLDAKLSKGCMEHAEYMRLNKDTDAMAGLNAHQQRPKLRGASAAGAACGKAADLFFGVSDLEVAVDGWMATLYHRRPILSPTLERIGVGYAKLRDGSYMAALMFVDSHSVDVTGKWPVEYPADNQSGVPLEFGSEFPNPVPGGGRAGYPITIQFPPYDKVTGVRATLVDESGKAVAFHLSDPEHPAMSSFGQWGVVCLIPKLPLAPEQPLRGAGRRDVERQARHVALELHDGRAAPCRRARRGRRHARDQRRQHAARHGAPWRHDGGRRHRVPADRAPRNEALQDGRRS